MTPRASASPYARALLDAVQASNPEQVEQDLTAFAAIVSRNAELQTTFRNPAIPAAAKTRIVERLVQQAKLSGPLARLLVLLAQRDDLALLNGLAAEYRERLAELRQVIRAEVTTAEPLTPERLAQFEQRLAKATGRRVAMTSRVDAGLIGGAVARVGSVVYDGSIATQLTRMRERLEKTR